MMKFAENFGTAEDETYGFVPPTFTLPGSQEMARLDAYMKAHPKATFIAKPQVGSQGDAISLFKELRDLPYGLDQKEVVVQRYLDKPLLLDEVKFDLRIYVAVFGVEEMSAYICDEGLARFCTSKYEAPTRSNFKKAFMHLTNYSINKMSEEYVRP